MQLYSRISAAASTLLILISSALYGNDARATTLTIQKVSAGGVGLFTFTGTNGWTSQSIITTTVGVAVPGATQTLAIEGTATTITESSPPGYLLTGVSCTGMGSGGIASLNGNSLTLSAAATAAGANIVCTFTNTRLPTLTLTKVSNGGVGAFTFSGTNGWSTQTITTTTPDTGVSGATQTLTSPVTATTITEIAPPGYLLTGVSCTGMGSSGIASLNGNSLTLSAAATAPGANIVCTFNNARLPTLTVTKVSNGGVGAFNFSGTNGWSSQTITTTTPGIGASGTTQTLASPSIATTITEFVPPGYLLTGTSCTGMGSGGTATLNGNSLTLSAAATAPGANIACTFTNARLPTLTLTKVSNGGVGTFTFSGTNGWATQTIATATPGIGVSGVTQSLAVAGAAATITDSGPAGYVLASANCAGVGPGGTATVTGNTLTLDAAATAAGSNITCTLVNSLLPTLTKAFSPTTLPDGGATTLTFTLANPSGAAATTASFIDTLPGGLQIVGGTSPAIGGSCSNIASAGVVTTTAGSSGAITVNGLAVPAGGACTVSVAVTNATGQTNATCPNAAFTNGAGNISGAASVSNGVTDQCVRVVSPSLSVVKRSSLAAYNTVAANTVVYSVIVSNTGAGTAQSVDVSDLPPTQIGNWASVTCSAGAGSNCGTASTSGSIGASIAADSSLTFTYTGTIPAGTTSTIVNTATVTGSGCAAGCTATHVLAPANPATAGTLTISKRASLAAYTPTGGALSYDIVINNATNTAVVGATVTDTVPAVLGVPTASCPSGCTSGPTVSGQTVAATATVPAFGSVVVRINGAIPSNTTGVITNVATLVPPAGSSCVPMLGNACTASVDIAPISIAATPANVILSKYAAQGSYFQGGPISYSIQVSNVGGSVANNVALGDVVPPAITLSSVTCAPAACTVSSGLSSNVVATVATLAPGASATLTVSGIVAVNSTGVISNIASTSGNCSPVTNLPNAGDCSSTALVAPAPRVVIAKSLASGSPVTPGVPLDYALTLTNTAPGTTQAAGYRLLEVVPANTVFASVSGNATTDCIANTSVAGTLCTVTVNAPISGGAPVVVHFVVMPATPFPTTSTTVVNQFYYATAPAACTGEACAAPRGCGLAGSATVCTPPIACTANDSSCVSTAAATAAPPSITKRGRMLDDGVTVEWTITVVNNSASNAQLTPVGFNVIDVLPASMIGSSVTCVTTGNTGTTIASCALTAGGTTLDVTGTLAYTADAAATTASQRVDVVVRGTLAPGLTTANTACVNVTAQPAQNCSTALVSNPARPVPADAWWTLLLLAAALAGISARAKATRRLSRAAQ